VSNLFARIVWLNPIVVRAFKAATIVKAMPNSPKSSGTSNRASTTERTKRVNSPISDDDTVQLTPERTRLRSGKFVVSAWSAIISADGVSVGRNGVTQYYSSTGLSRLYSNTIIRAEFKKAKSVAETLPLR
jgi:hypothetical protein